MQPFYFGTSAQQLFGVYHAPEARARNAAAVLCHPIGHEYLRAHRAFRNLAASLASNGWHVLRFDYLGSGDSSGNDDLTTVDQCLADIGHAIQEIKDISGVQKVTLVGLRLGATFAAIAASRRKDVDRLVLWDPVVDGGAYISDLAGLHRRWLTDRMGPKAAQGSSGRELIGLPLTDDIASQLAAATLQPLPKVTARRVALFVSEANARYETLRRSLVEAGVEPGVELVPGAGEWDNGELVHQILLPHAMVRAIAASLAA